MTVALGIDIGGTGIKAAIVDTGTGELRTDRVKLATPKGGEPEPIVDTTLQVIDRLGGVPDGAPVGICFPSVVKHGRTLTANNISKAWIGLDAEARFASAIGRPIAFVNDADAAGVAELEFGAAKDVTGTVIVTTLGTGIGSAFIWEGHLVPNVELGSIELNGKMAERRASYGAKERDDLSWKQWTKRLQEYYELLERVFSPDLFVVGGGVAKHADEFLPLLRLTTPIIPARLLNSAGIIGAATLAARAQQPGATPLE